MSQSGQQRGPANDTGFSASDPAGTPEKNASESRYFFEICQARPQNQGGEPSRGGAWLWRLISPAGAALIECGDYSDEASCRDAVALLKEKAGDAEISVRN